MNDSGQIVDGAVFVLWPILGVCFAAVVVVSFLGMIGCNFSRNPRRGWLGVGTLPGLFPIPKGKNTNFWKEEESGAELETRCGLCGAYNYLDLEQVPNKSLVSLVVKSCQGCGKGYAVLSHLTAHSRKKFKISED